MIIIVAPTNRGAEPANELADAVEVLADRFGSGHVQIAVRGGDTTTICDALDRAHDHQPAKVIMVSAQTVPDRSFDAWCRRVVGHWIRTTSPKYPILLAPSLARQPGYLGALTQAVEAADSPITGKTAPLLSPAWETVPGFGHHVLVCRGPRCSALGAGELASALATELDRRGLGDDDVLLTQTGCLFPCNQGPVLVVYPDNTWYARLAPADVPQLVEQHLVSGRVLRDRLAPRRDGR